LVPLTRIPCLTAANSKDMLQAMCTEFVWRFWQGWSTDALQGNRAGGLSRQVLPAKFVLDHERTSLH